MVSIPAAFASYFEHQEDDEVAQQDDPENSRPLNFDTFVPRHDPSLAQGKPGTSCSVGAMPNGIIHPPTSLNGVSPEEAFQHAMGAWYSAGYWTGVYHVSVSLYLLSTHPYALNTSLRSAIL